MMGLEAMTKTEMIEILRGKVLTESPEEIQARLNEIADELEQSERVVRCKDCRYFRQTDKFAVCATVGIVAEVYDNDYCSLAERKGKASE